jgi:hypothetical protein
MAHQSTPAHTVVLRKGCERQGGGECREEAGDTIIEQGALDAQGVVLTCSSQQSRKDRGTVPMLSCFSRPIAAVASQRRGNTVQGDRS